MLHYSHSLPPCQANSKIVAANYNQKISNTRTLRGVLKEGKAIEDTKIEKLEKVEALALIEGIIINYQPRPSET